MHLNDFSRAIAFLRRKGFEDAADELERSEEHRGPPLVGVMGADVNISPEAARAWLADQDGRVVTPEMVVMPHHYGRHKFEPIQFAVENMGPTFLIGNIVKYIMRYDAKDGHKDLAKAARYVEMLREYEDGRLDWYKPYDGSQLPDQPTDPLRSRDGFIRND